MTLRSQDVLNGFGFDTHIAYTDGGYANIANVEADMAYLGVSNIRDGISNGVNGAAPLSSYINVAQHGGKFTFIVGAANGTYTTQTLADQLALFDQVNEAVPGSVVAVEGPNEINNQQLTYNGVGGESGAEALQRDLYSMVHADTHLSGATVDYFTGYGTVGNNQGSNPSTTPGLADFDNQHPYPQFGQQPAFWVNPSFALSNESSPFGPFVYTETGYSTNGGTNGAVNADVQAKQTLNLLMDATKNGASKTFLYQLMDAYQPGSPQGDDGYGLFDTSNNPKPVAVGIHNIEAILADTGATATTFNTTASAATVSGLSSTGNSMTIEKSDGTQDIAVWDEKPLWDRPSGTETIPANTSAVVSLGATYETVNVYDPLLGTTPIATYNNVSSVTLSLGASPLIVEVKPHTETTPTASLAATFNWNPTTQLTHLIAAEASGNGARIIAVGDSTTLGFGSQTDGTGQDYRSASYPNDLAHDLATGGAAINTDATFGGEDPRYYDYDNRVTFTGAGAFAGPGTAGGYTTEMPNAGDSEIFTLTTPKTYNQVSVEYIDSGSGVENVEVDGSIVGTITAGSTYLSKTATFAVPLGVHSNASIVSTNSNSTFFEGISFKNTVTPSTQIINDGIGGQTAVSGASGYGTPTAGFGIFPSEVAQNANMALIDYGINDINNGVPLSQTIAALTTIITDFQAEGTDPVLVIPEPIAGTSYANQITAFRTAIESLSTQYNVGVIDLSTTYGNNWMNLYNAGLISADNLHPNAAGYADIASKIDGLLAPVIPTAPVTNSDTLDLHISEDNWQGDAQYTIGIDGQQIGGVRTATASHSAGQTQDVSLVGNWGNSALHTVSVSFINDLYGGPNQDRNLYVDSVKYDNTALSGTPAALFNNSTANFNTVPNTTPTTTDLTLHLSEDAWNGDAQYAVAIDGNTVIANATETVLHSSGNSEAIDLKQALSAGTHDIAISFLNDAWGGSDSTDRNLYINGIDVNGTPQLSGTTEIYATATDHFSITVPHS